MFEQEVDPEDGQIIYHVDSAHGSLSFKMEPTYLSYQMEPTHLSYHPVTVVLLPDVLGPVLQVSDIEDLIGGLIMLRDIMLDKTINEKRRRHNTIEETRSADMISNLEYNTFVSMDEETNDESQ